MSAMFDYLQNCVGVGEREREREIDREEFIFLIAYKLNVSIYQSIIFVIL